MKKLLSISLLLFTCILLYSQEEKLEVDGAIQIANSSDPTPDEGTIRFNSSMGVFQGYTGSQWVSFNSPAGATEVVYDIDGNRYLTVDIGTQTWMKENLRTSRYSDGTPIALVIDNTIWAAQDSSGKYRWYNDDWTLDQLYGKMYNWHAVNDSRGLCPENWHTPTDAEWTVLSDFLGGLSYAGGKMKIPRTVIWQSPNGSATNESGFTGLPGGYLFESGTFDYIGQFGAWWSSTENSNTNAWNRAISYAHGLMSRISSDKRRGYSVRCVKD